MNDGEITRSNSLEKDKVNMTISGIMLESPSEQVETTQGGLNKFVYEKLVPWCDETKKTVEGQYKDDEYNITSESDLKAHISTDINIYDIVSKADLDLVNQNKKQLYLYRARQVYFSVNLDERIKNASDYFNDNVSLTDVRNSTDDKSPLGVVTNVEYGRDVYIAFLSNYCSNSFVQSLSIAFEPEAERQSIINKMSAEEKVEYSNVINNVNVKVSAIGCSDESLKGVNDAIAKRDFSAVRGALSIDSSLKNTKEDLDRVRPIGFCGNWVCSKASSGGSAYTTGQEMKASSSIKPTRFVTQTVSPQCELDDSVGAYQQSIILKAEYIKGFDNDGDPIFGKFQCADRGDHHPYINCPPTMFNIQVRMKYAGYDPRYMETCKFKATTPDYSTDDFYPIKTNTAEGKEYKYLDLCSKYKWHAWGGCLTYSSNLTGKSIMGSDHVITGGYGSSTHGNKFFANWITS